VVVPIYNVEDYLGSCLESIAEQTFADLEVVLVDDGSPDRSGAIAEEFARGREGWQVLHVDNGGLGRARKKQHVLHHVAQRVALHIFRVASGG